MLQADKCRQPKQLPSAVTIVIKTRKTVFYLPKDRK